MPAMAAIDTALGRIGIIDQGGGESIPLVFLHGVGSDKSVWAAQVEHFGQSRRTIALDYPGYGESDFVDGASRDDFAAAMLAAMDSLGVERAHICGLSLGGVIAIAINAAAPQRTVSLILADTFASHPDGPGIYERSVAAADSGSLRPLAESRADVLLAQPCDPAVRTAVIETMSAIDPAAYKLGAEAVWLAAQEERAHEIRCPTLVLCGDCDRVTPPSLSTALTKIIPGARMELIEGAGHLGNLERPAAFDTLVNAFIRGVDSHL